MATHEPGKPIERTPIDGHEIEILDAMMPALQPKAVGGDAQSIDQVVKILELRLKYRRQRIAESDT